MRGSAQTNTAGRRSIVVGMGAAIVLMTGLLGGVARAATPAIPSISAPVSGPGLAYPNPAISVVPAAKKVEDFAYITEEFFVTGTANEMPYSTRIIVRRPRDPNAFS